MSFLSCEEMLAAARSQKITLAEAVENAPTCPANGNASDFTKATDDIRTYADNLRNITNELDAAAKSVVASQELKLESAK